MSATGPPPAETSRPARFSARGLLPLAALVIAVVAVFAFDLDRFLTFDALGENRARLTSFAAENGLLAALVYVVIYVATVTMSLPGGAVLTIAGGFLFGTVLGSLLVVLAATAGATLLFLIARTALGEPLRAKAGPFLKRMEAGFHENAFSYLLALRLIPLFPLFIVSLVPAFLGVRLRTYVLATFVGIIPGTLVLATVGAGLGGVLDRSEQFSPASVLTPEILLALIGLAVLALLPVAFRKP
jgi:uncharacterized membrane protein YdjX (TVP38/TMEM64 family)